MIPIRTEFQRSASASQEIQRDDLVLAFSELLNRVEALVPAGRERSLVVTKLQEAFDWAFRGMVVR